MGTRFVLHGDERKARGLVNEANRQLFILKNAMRFQNLKQLKRIAILSDGSRIVCSSVFGIDNVRIEAFSGGVEIPVVIKVYFCWCNSCFAEGIVMEVIGDYQSTGPWFKEIPGDDVQESHKFYPLYCQYNASDELKTSYIQRYEGIRYRVKVCRGEKGHDQEFICASSDFAGFEVDDKVIVLFMGLWPNDFAVDFPGPFEQNRDTPGYLEKFSPCSCDYSEQSGAVFLCEACTAEARIDQKDAEADGSFLILPMKVESINADN